MSEPSPASRSARWWPALLAIAGAVIAYGVLFFIPHKSQQHFNLNVARVVLVLLGVLLIWLLGFSRLPWRRRFAGLAAFVATLGLLAATFRIHGVDGDLVPIIEPRWARRSMPVVVAPPAPARIHQAATAPPGAADFPQFLGPDRNGILAGPRLATNWVARPPVQLWRQPVGAAWSGFVVSGRLAVTQEQRGEEELITAYDLETGRLVWSHADAARYFTTLAGEGPRANPTIAGGRVFAQGATGRFTCLELATGRLIWSKDILIDHDGKVPDWGLSSSPLVYDDVVVANPGGRADQSLVAYAVADGAVRWAGGKFGASYSSPVLRAFGDSRQVLVFDDSLVACDATNGAALWSYKWPGGHPHVALPVFVGTNDVILSSGYGTGSARITVARGADGKWTARQVWRTNRLKSKFSNPVLHGGHLYGLDDGIMACLDAATGEMKWKDGKYGHGQVLLVRGRLLVMAEAGEIVLIDPSPAGLRELTRFKVLADKTWNPPALAGEYLLVRNDKEASCHRLPVEAP